MWGTRFVKGETLLLSSHDFSGFHDCANEGIGRNNAVVTIAEDKDTLMNVFIFHLSYIDSQMKKKSPFENKI